MVYSAPSPPRLLCTSLLPLSEHPMPEVDMPTRKQTAPPLSGRSFAEGRETFLIVTPQSSPQDLLLHERARLDKM